jgi:hypothetical protein
LQRDNELAGRSVNDDDKQKERKLRQKRKTTNKDADGDGGLFSEEIIQNAKKPKNESSDAPVKSR